MGNPGVPLTHWQTMAIAADRGHLYLNPEAAATCSAACDEYIKKLVGHQSKAKLLADVDGWGDFDSGQALRTIFSEKAVGGDNNMVDVLESHIQVVREMQIVFQKSFVSTGALDQRNAADLTQSGPPS